MNTINRKFFATYIIPVIIFAYIGSMIDLFPGPIDDTIVTILLLAQRQWMLEK